MFCLNSFFRNQLFLRLISNGIFLAEHEYTTFPVYALVTAQLGDYRVCRTSFVEMLFETKICFYYSNNLAAFSALLTDVKKYVKLYTILSHCALFIIIFLVLPFVLLVTLRICLLCTIKKITFLSIFLFMVIDKS